MTDAEKFNRRFRVGDVVEVLWVPATGKVKTGTIVSPAIMFHDLAIVEVRGIHGEHLGMIGCQFISFPDKV